MQKGLLSLVLDLNFDLDYLPSRHVIGIRLSSETSDAPPLSRRSRSRLLRGLVLDLDVEGPAVALKKGEGLRVDGVRRLGSCVESEGISFMY